MFNPKRGDVAIELGTGTVILRPTFAVIMRLEAAYDRSIFDLARAFARGEISRASDIQKIIKLTALPDTLPDEPVLNDALIDYGLGRLLASLGHFFARACGLDDSNANE